VLMTLKARINAHHHNDVGSGCHTLPEAGHEFTVCFLIQHQLFPVLARSDPHKMRGKAVQALHDELTSWHLLQILILKERRVLHCLL